MIKLTKVDFIQWSKVENPVIVNPNQITHIFELEQKMFYRLNPETNLTERNTEPVIYKVCQIVFAVGMNEDVDGIFVSETFEEIEQILAKWLD